MSLLLLATGAAFAQQSSDVSALSLEDLLNVKIYSASKYEQKAAEAPSSISVITAEEIRHYGYRNLQEALQSVTGFYVANHGSYSTLGVRGFAPPGDSNGRILFLVNGHALNNNIDDSVLIGDAFPVDVDLIDRIEIVRGPSSSLYGADAFFGVVNVITRTGKSQGTMVNGEAGSLGTYKENATYGIDRKGTQALFSASYWDTAAPGTLDNIQNPGGPTSAHDQSRKAFALISSHGFTLQAAGSTSQSHSPDSASWCGACHQTDTHTTTFQGYADLQYERPVWKGVQMTARTYLDGYSYHGTYNDRRTCSSEDSHCHVAGNPTAPQLIDYDIAHGNKAGVELKLSRQFLDKHRVTVGTEYRDNFKQAQDNSMVGYTIPPSTTSLALYNRTSAIWGIYAEGEFHLLHNLILNAGVRNDRYNYSFGSTTNPRGALIYTPRKATTLKFLYGTAFRAPSFSEMYYEGMQTILGQSTLPLKPEKIRTFEGDIEQQFGHRATLNAAIFYNNIGNYIEEGTVIARGQDATSYFNSKASAKGAELELVSKLPSGIEARLSYTYQDACSMPNAPKHLEKLNIADPLLHGKLTPAFEAQYMSRSTTAWPSVGYSAPPVLVNFTVSSRQLWQGFSLSGGVYNLAGRSFSESTVGYCGPQESAAGVVSPCNPGGTEPFSTTPANSLLPEDRRSFRFKITWTSGEHADKDKSNTHPEETH